MKKILVAEDDKFLSQAYKLKLARAGFDVRVAIDGQDTLEILKTFTPDIILLDMIMPVKGGMAVLQEIKADEKLKNIPVVVTSNLEQKDQIDEGFKLGAVDYLIKSNISMDDLVKKIENVLSKTSTPPAATAK
jgi:two-component system, OmpR family, alkaline phosphatase synthesis response regulator PhoP